MLSGLREVLRDHVITEHFLVALIDHIVFQGWFMSLMLPTLRQQKGTKVLIGDNLSSHISGEVM